jgi:hypothetical protein
MQLLSFDINDNYNLKLKIPTEAVVFSIINIFNNLILLREFCCI